MRPSHTSPLSSQSNPSRYTHRAAMNYKCSWYGTAYHRIIVKAYFVSHDGNPALIIAGGRTVQKAVKIRWKVVVCAVYLPVCVDSAKWLVMQSENTALVLGVTLNLKYFPVIHTYVSGACFRIIYFQPSDQCLCLPSRARRRWAWARIGSRRWWDLSPIHWKLFQIHTRHKTRTEICTK